MSIIIFSRPIHSGKTTELLQWCDRQENIYGILMPDINGSRKILDIKTKEIFDIQCADPANTEEPLTSIGKFHFYTAAFERANAILLDAMAKDPGWLIIDEVGKLELEEKGFYNAVQKATVFYNNKKKAGNLLIIVRDSLCEKVISFFRLHDYTIIQRLEELS